MIANARDDLRRYAKPMPTRGVRAICAALERAYGSPRLGNLDDPLDELVYIILSTRTQERSFARTYERVKATFPTWDDVDASDRPALEEILRPNGLGALKARQIVDALAAIRSRFGAATLEPLSSLADDEVEDFLTTLPGVSRKVAKCVSMYSLGRDVMPVDVHVHRVAGRLGFAVKKRPDTSQDMIERAIPPDLRYGFHVNAVAHGRAVCLPRAPRCAECCVARWCSYYRVHQGKATA